MKKTEGGDKVLVVVPYRDAYFVNKYGFAVRDTQVIEEIRRSGAFDKIYVVNRPVSIHERILGLKKKSESKWPNVSTVDVTSFDFFGPLRKRMWLISCYRNIIADLVLEIRSNDSRCKIVLLDFQPFAQLGTHLDVFDDVFLWFDAIDNFVKHNRFSDEEKRSVREKYRCVRSTYNFVSGVSESAVSQIGHDRNFVFSNGVFGLSDEYAEVHARKMHDFGFIGFVTDKFDLDIVRKLRSKGYSVVIHGKVYDNSVALALRSLGVQLTGEFRYSEIGEKVTSFKVGLLPYLVEKEHDGSPLKLYEYLKFNRPCLTSIDYEVKSVFCVNYNKALDVDTEIVRLLEISGSREISSEISNEWLLSNKIELVLAEIF